MSYFAVVATQHVHPIPAGLAEPQGVFASIEEARAYLRDNMSEWFAVAGHWPFERCTRIAEYATRKAAIAADPSDQFVGRGGPIISAVSL